MNYIITYTAKPLSRGWYRISKNYLPQQKNKAGVGYSNPTKKIVEFVCRTKNPKKLLLSLAKQKN